MLARQTTETLEAREGHIRLERVSSENYELHPRGCLTCCLHLLGNTVASETELRSATLLDPPASASLDKKRNHTPDPVAVLVILFRLIHAKFESISCPSGCVLNSAEFLSDDPLSDKNFIRSTISCQLDLHVRRFIIVIGKYYACFRLITVGDLTR